MGPEIDALVASDALVQAVLLLMALVVARFLLGVVAAALVRLPGRLGPGAARVGRALRPGLARRVLAATLGLAAPAATVLADLPAASAVAVDRPGLALVGRPTIPPPDSPAALTAPTLATPPVDPRTVVVRPGDTLWDIARRHLPRTASSGAIAAAWPRWYAANRAAIGPDPALLRPGTHLRSPDRRRAGTPAPSHHRPPAARTGLGAVARSLDPDRR